MLSVAGSDKRPVPVLDLNRTGGASINTIEPSHAQRPFTSQNTRRVHSILPLHLLPSAGLDWRPPALHAAISFDPEGGQSPAVHGRTPVGALRWRQGQQRQHRGRLSALQPNPPPTRQAAGPVGLPVAGSAASQSGCLAPKIHHVQSGCGTEPAACKGGPVDRCRLICRQPSILASGRGGLELPSPASHPSIARGLGWAMLDSPGTTTTQGDRG